jgi:hypothetical protein
MNLFRSEEHLRNWAGFRPEYVEQLRPLDFWLERFSNEMMRNRLRPDFMTWYGEWRLAQARQR